MANRARDGDWGTMRTEEEQWRLAGCYYLALRCLIYLLHAFPSLTLVRLPTAAKDEFMQSHLALRHYRRE
jgi:hypothetical protein